MCEKQYKRYVTMGLRDGKLHHIIARRGITPDDIIEKTLTLIQGPPYLTRTDLEKRRFDRLYIMEVGDEGTFGNRMNLRLLEITKPLPVPKWRLMPVRGLY